MRNKYEEKFNIYTNLNRYLFNSIPKEKSVLDVGCGTGILGKHLKKEKNCKVYGVDISKNAVKNSRRFNLQKFYSEYGKIIF